MYTGAVADPGIEHWVFKKQKSHPSSEANGSWQYKVFKSMAFPLFSDAILPTIQRQWPHSVTQFEGRLMKSIRSAK